MTSSDQSPDSPSGAAFTRLACEAMGTRFEIVLTGDDPVRLRAAGEAAIAEIHDWHARLSFFERSSFISHINAEAASRAVACDGEVFTLLQLCQQVWHASGGAFDPSVAALMRAAGFRDAARDPSAMRDALVTTGFQHVILDPAARTIRFARSGIGLDLGAIGKGWALDRAAVALREAGIRRALLHGGTSSVLALGAPDDLQGWNIAIHNPARESREDVNPIVTLQNTALGVSAPHGRVINDGAASAGHVLDPRTGQSISSVALAAAITHSAALADAWSTAVLVLGNRPESIPPDLTSIIARKDPAGSLQWHIAGPGSVRLPAGRHPAI